MQAQTLNISLPKNLVKEVDQLAKTEYRNRSELIREALRIYLARKVTWNKIFKAGEKAAKQMGVITDEDVVRIVREYRNAKKAQGGS